MIQRKNWLIFLQCRLENATGMWSTFTQVDSLKWKWKWLTQRKFKSLPFILNIIILISTWLKL